MVQGRHKALRGHFSLKSVLEFAPNRIQPFKSLEKTGFKQEPDDPQIFIWYRTQI